MGEVLGRRYGQWTKQAERSPCDADRDPSFAALPNLIVIDGGGPARGRPRGAAGLTRARGGGQRVSLAKRIEEVFLRGHTTPVRLPHDARAANCSSACATRHTASRSPPGIRRDRAMTESIMDELPDIGPARKRALLKHFGSLDAVLGGFARGARAGTWISPEGRARPLRSPQQDGAMSENGRHYIQPNEDFVIISGLSRAGSRRP